MIKETGGAFAPREITPPTMPAQDTKGRAVTPTNTPTVTLTPTTPSNTGAPPTMSPALAIQDNLPGRQGMGWAPANAVVANTPINAAGQTQIIGLSDFAVKQGTFNVAPYDAAAAYHAAAAPAAAAASTYTAAQLDLAGQRSSGVDNDSLNEIRSREQYNAAMRAQGGTQAASLRYDSSTGRVQSYASGGMIEEPVDGRGRITGATYAFAERGKERVMPEGPYKTQIKLRSGHMISVGGSD